MAVGTPLSMAKAPVAAKPTQQTKAVSHAAAGQKWKGAPGRSLSTGGVFGKMGQLPQVASVGGGKTTRAAALPNPLPIPGGGMMSTASVRERIEAFDRRNIDIIKEAIDWKRLALAMGGRRRPYRSPEELMGLGKAAPRAPTPAMAAPPASPAGPRSTAEALDSFDFGLPPVVGGPAQPIPRPSVKRSVPSSDDDLFFGDW